MWKSYDNFFKSLKIVVALVLWATGMFSMSESESSAATFYVAVLGAEMFLCIANAISSYFNKKVENDKEDK